MRSGERVEHFDTVRVRSDGDSIQVSLTISPIKDAAGRVVGASKIARDITERRRGVMAVRELNETLELRVAERTAELAEANSLRTALLAAVSHDLRTPLAAIKAAATSLLSQEVAWSSDDTRDFAKWNLCSGRSHDQYPTKRVKIVPVVCEIADVDRVALASFDGSCDILTAHA